MTTNHTTDDRRPTADLISQSDEDDAACEALFDLSSILADRDETCVIGGHMVSLLSAAFPSPGLTNRHTGDADAGIPLNLASSEELHDLLLGIGYSATSGNRYVKKSSNGTRPTIDLLVPSFTGRFGDKKQGSRAFNTMPGLGPALLGGIDIDTTMTLNDGRHLACLTRVPTLENSIILKALAWRDRHVTTVKDGVDLSNLFAIRHHHHESNALGPWTLHGDLKASKRDGAIALHSLADRWEVRPPARIPIDVRLLIARIRRHVSLPDHHPTT